jgi:hypothetical protein
MTRRIILGMAIGALMALTLAPAVAAEDPPPAWTPGKGDVTITTAKVDRAGNAIIDFQVTCEVAMRGAAVIGGETYGWSVRVDQYLRKGAKAFGSVGPVQWGYFCKPGEPMSPYHGDQFVENGALFIRPGWQGTAGPEASAAFAPGYATVSINIGWTLCPDATDWQSCDTIIAALETDPFEDTPALDAFWTYQTVKLVRSR